MDTDNSTADCPTVASLAAIAKDGGLSQPLSNLSDTLKQQLLATLEAEVNARLATLSSQLSTLHTSLHSQCSQFLDTLVPQEIRKMPLGEFLDSLSEKSSSNVDSNSKKRPLEEEEEVIVDQVPEKPQEEVKTKAKAKKAAAATTKRKRVRQGTDSSTITVGSTTDTITEEVTQPIPVLEKEEPAVKPVANTPEPPKPQVAEAAEPELPQPQLQPERPTAVVEATPARSRRGRPKASTILPTSTNDTTTEPPRTVTRSRATRATRQTITHQQQPQEEKDSDRRQTRSHITLAPHVPLSTRLHAQDTEPQNDDNTLSFHPLLPTTPSLRKPRRNETLLSMNGSPVANPFALVQSQGTGSMFLDESDSKENENNGRRMTRSVRASIVVSSRPSLAVSSLANLANNTDTATSTKKTGKKGKNTRATKSTASQNQSVEEDLVISVPLATGKVVTLDPELANAANLGTKEKQEVADQLRALQDQLSRYLTQIEGL